MPPVISVENLSKSYRLGQIGTGTFTHDLAVWWAKMRGKPNPMLRIGEQDHGNRDSEELWALKNVSFTVEQGEVLGIIGRNGAGKSTLLKILSRVTAPTSGRIRVRGRVASLLEVGTGFHPELTGRENIYLNGAILGMTKQEVARKFDEIVDFAEVEKFIDTPVKRYSSGMYVRLAFAVAAHLEPEILVVDEVLAVGDLEFQKKCLGKMGDVAANEGRAILFVSHNMDAILKLCKNGILLRNGYMDFSGEIQNVVDKYTLSVLKYNTGIIDTSTMLSRKGSGSCRIVKVEMENEYGEITSNFGVGEPFSIIFYAKVLADLPKLIAGVEIRDQTGIYLLHLRSDSVGIYHGPFNQSDQLIKFIVKVPGLPLYAGSYFIEPWLAPKKATVYDHIEQSIVIQLSSKGKFKHEVRHPSSAGRGFISMDCEWDAVREYKVPLV